MRKQSDQSPPGFDFSIVNDSALTDHDCDDVAFSLEWRMAGWVGPRAHVRLADDHTIAITVSGPLTVAEYRIVTNEIAREARRLKAERVVEGELTSQVWRERRAE